VGNDAEISNVFHKLKSDKSRKKVAFSASIP
jgi:hypothetical protein